MRKYCIAILSVVLAYNLFFHISDTYSQENDSDLRHDAPFTLKSAIQTAFKNNKNIQIQEKEIKSAKANILEVQSSFLPTLYTKGSFTYNDQISPIGDQLPQGKRDPHIFSGYNSDNKAGAYVDLPIFRGGGEYAVFNQAEWNLKIQLEKLRAVKLDVEFEAKRLYYGLLLAYETERITEELAAQAQAHYEDVESMYNQGTSSRFDLLQSKLQVSLLMPELIKAKSAIKLIMADFNKLLSLPIHNPVEITGRLEFEPITIDEGEFLKSAYLNEPEMILKSLGVDVDKWSIEVARANGMPTMDASFGQVYRSDSVGDLFTKRHSNWDFGLSVSIPIFDGYSTKAKVDQAKVKYEQAKLQKADVADKIAVDIRQACLDLKESKAVVDSQKDNIAVAEEALKIAIVRYDNGVGTNLDVLDSQTSLGQVQQNLAEGVYDYLIAEASLERTMGKSALEGENNEKKN